MRYNRDVCDYNKFIEEMKKETKLQSELYKKIGMTRNKIKRLERELDIKTLELQKKKIIKDLLNYNKDLDKYANELEFSRARYHYFEQKVCNHDFGVIINTYNSEGKTISSGICLECDAEINDKEGKIFTHSVNISGETKGVLKIEDYKNRLEKLMKKHNYYNSSYDYDLGEQITNELYDEARSLKKKISRLK